MEDPQGDGRLDPALARWVEQTLGGRIGSLARPGVGGSRETWFVGIDGGGVDEAVLRVEAGSSFTGTDVNVEREAIVYRALEATPVPVPRVLGVAPGAAAVLLERLPGGPDLPVDPASRQATLEHFIDVIADLHLVDVDQLDLPGFPRPREAVDHARLDLDRWRRLGEQTGGVLDPLVCFAGSWLLANPPDAVARTVLVQGDTGPGNFMVSEGRVTGLIDMEFAHLGDPMDDIAWLLGRAFAGGEADAGPFLARYSERSGIAIDAGSVAYYHLAVQYRCAVTTTLAVARGGGARGWAPYLMVTARYLAAIATALRELLPVDDEQVEVPTGPPTARTPMYDALLEGIRAGVRGIADPELKEATRNNQILVHLLRAEDRLGPVLADLDRADRADVGVDADRQEDLQQLATEAGARGDLTVLRYLLRRTARNGALWATLLERPAR